eukprot:152754-Chlamydomonas_euryale.AAC.16
MTFVCRRWRPAQGSPPKIPGGATLNFEVELFRWDSHKDISGDGGVLKDVIKTDPDAGYEMPSGNDEVTGGASHTMSPSRHCRAGGDDGCGAAMTGQHCSRRGGGGSTIQLNGGIKGAIRLRTC